MFLLYFIFMEIKHLFYSKIRTACTATSAWSLAQLQLSAISVKLLIVLPIKMLNLMKHCTDSERHLQMLLCQELNDLK